MCHFYSHPSFYCLGSNKYQTKFAVHWVTNGIDSCRVDFLPDCYLPHLLQVLSIHGDSFSRRKWVKAMEHYGVCTAMLVDQYCVGDKVISRLVVDYDTDSSVDES